MRALALLLLASCAAPDLAPDELHLGYGFGDGASDFEGSRADFDTEARLYSLGLTWHLSADMTTALLDQQARTVELLLQERLAAHGLEEAPPDPAPRLDEPGGVYGPVRPEVTGFVRGLAGAIGGEPWAAAAAGLLTVVGGVFASSKRARARAKKVVRYVRRK